MSPGPCPITAPLPRNGASMAQAEVFAFPLSTLTPFRADFLHPRPAASKPGHQGEITTPTLPPLQNAPPPVPSSLQGNGISQDFIVFGEGTAEVGGLGKKGPTPKEKREREKGVMGNEKHEGMLAKRRGTERHRRDWQRTRKKGILREEAPGEVGWGGAQYGEPQAETDPGGRKRPLQGLMPGLCPKAQKGPKAAPEAGRS